MFAVVCSSGNQQAEWDDDLLTDFVIRIFLHCKTYKQRWIHKVMNIYDFINMLHLLCCALRNFAS